MREPAELKPFKEHDELLQMLEENGLKIPSSEIAKKELRRHGYHRLSGYRYLFREMLPFEQQNSETRTFRSKQHLAGSSFEDVIALAEFDSRLRLSIVEALADFEVRLRTAVAHTLAAKDELAHLKVDKLDRRSCLNTAKGKRETNHEVFCKEVARVTAMAIRSDDFAKHHDETYGSDLPVWAVVEHLTFGSLHYLFGFMKNEDKRTVANAFGLRHPKALEKWLYALVDLRNLSNHSARLFNRSLKRSIVIPPHTVSPGGLLKQTEEFLDRNKQEKDRLYAVVAVLAYLLKSHEFGSEWPTKFREVMLTFPYIELAEFEDPLVSPQKNMGFPEHWQGDELWLP